MKNANICFTVLLVLLILSAGFATLNIASAVRYAEKESYERIESRYITESGITLAEGLFLNYLDSRSYALSYEDNGGETGEKRSKIKPVYLTVISEYKGGRVMCNMKIDGLYLVRGAMHDLGGETLGSVSAYIDTSNCEVEYENYQSFQN